MPPKKNNQKRKTQKPHLRRRTSETLEKVVTAPAVALEKAVDVTKEVGEKVRENVLPQKDSFWQKLGPGLTTGAADDDPAGITTYSQAGAQYGLNLIWLSGFTFPLMAVVQEMCARIGLVTGRGLAANIRRHYPNWVMYAVAFLLFCANTFNIGANLGAMAKATQLLLPGTNFIVLILLFTFVSLMLQVFTSYAAYAKYLKWLTLILFSYVLTAFLIDLDWGEVFLNFVIPKLDFSKEQILLVTGILGTTISPYLFFWQTSQEVEERVLEGKTTIKSRENSHISTKRLRDMRIDVWSGMFVSNLVMFFIIAACAATLHAEGVTAIATAADAAEALRPLAGPNATLLFTIGILGTGMLAIPVLAGSATYAVAESFHWKEGLYRKLHESYPFYGVLILAMLAGLLMNFTGIDPIKALIFSAILNGLIAPIVLYFIVSLSTSEKVMKGKKNGPIMTFLGWFIAVVMAIAGIATIGSFVID